MDGYHSQMLTYYRDMVIDRHDIWKKRQRNEPGPWTHDPILANLKMTNMFRVLDPGSQFVFQLRSRNDLDVIARLVFYRITNLPATWYALRASLGDYPRASDFVEQPERLLAPLRARRDAGSRVFSGAYIIVPEPGTKNDKVEGAVRVVTRFLLENSTDFLTATSQEGRFAALQATPGLGKFLSMQILTDWGYLQKKEPDQHFIVAGPGARRGAALLNDTMPAEEVIYDLTDSWSDHPQVKFNGRSLTVMDVQNTMCEWSKFARELVNPRKKTPYRPTHPGVQPRPIVPAWW